MVGRGRPKKRPCKSTFKPKKLDFDAVLDEVNFPKLSDSVPFVGTSSDCFGNSTIQVTAGTSNDDMVGRNAFHAVLDVNFPEQSDGVPLVGTSSDCFGNSRL